MAQKGAADPEELDWEEFSNFLYTSDLPDPDLIVRTSGENRLERTARISHLGVDSEGRSVGSATLEQIPLTVLHKPIFRLYCAEAYLYAHRGSVFPYLMEVERQAGFQGKIVLQIGDRQNRDLDGIPTYTITRTGPIGHSVNLDDLYAEDVTGGRIEIEEGLRLQAKQSLDKMLEMASGTIGKGDLGKI